MDQALGVGGVQRAGHLRHHGDRSPGRERPELPQVLTEVGPFDVSHGDEQEAVELSRVVDGDDVGVVDGCGQPGLANEAVPEPLLLRQLGREDLERCPAPQPQVLGEVDQ